MLDNLEKEFWENYPHELSWPELKEININLYARLLNIGQILILNNRLNGKYLPEVK